MGFKVINITDIDGFYIGNAENRDAATGCTVIICEDGAVAGVDVRGGGPATRETDLLKSENTIEKIHAVVLSGGSAFGLEAGSGVMNQLERRGIGFKLGNIRIPIVCQASLFDLAVGRSDIRPDREMGEQACENAYKGIFARGNVGAGTGATVGKYYGMDRAMKSGLGSFACTNGAVSVGAVTAVNAFADVYDGKNQIIAGLLNEERDFIEGTINSLKSALSTNDCDNEAYENYEDVNADTDETPAEKENYTKNNESAESSAYSDAPVGEIKKEISWTNEKKSADDIKNNEIKKDDYQELPREELIEEYQKLKSEIKSLLGGMKNIEEQVNTADALLNKNDVSSFDIAGVLTAQNKNPNKDPENDAHKNEKDNTDTESDMGYDLSFNTTISCLVTNAKLTKAQANKLASILHDGFARAIKPVHSSLDGDTVFVMSTGECEVNFDAFAALAADMVQYSIIDAVMSAKDAYGLKSASSFEQN